MFEFVYDRVMFMCIHLHAYISNIFVGMLKLLQSNENVIRLYSSNYFK